MDRDYSVVVRPREPSGKPPFVIETEHGSAVMLCPRNGKRIVLEVHFRTVDEQDAFMASNRNPVDVFRHHGIFTVFDQQENADTGPIAESNAVPENLYLSSTEQMSGEELAKRLGLTLDELKVVRVAGLRAICARYREGQKE